MTYEERLKDLSEAVQGELKLAAHVEHNVLLQGKAQREVQELAMERSKQ